MFDLQQNVFRPIGIGQLANRNASSKNDGICYQWNFLIELIDMFFGQMKSFVLLNELSFSESGNSDWCVGVVK